MWHMHVGRRIGCVGVVLGSTNVGGSVCRSVCEVCVEGVRMTGHECE